MVRSRFHWAWLGACSLLVLSAACREREPVPPHNRNLGDGDQYLLPTPLADPGEPLKGNRNVEIPDRSAAAEIRSQADAATEAHAADTAPDEEGKGAISSFLSRLRGAMDAAPATGAERDVEPNAGEEEVPNEQD